MITSLDQVSFSWLFFIFITLWGHAVEMDFYIVSSGLLTSLCRGVAVETNDSAFDASARVSLDSLMVLGLPWTHFDNSSTSIFSGERASNRTCTSALMMTHHLSSPALSVSRGFCQYAGWPTFTIRARLVRSSPLHADFIFVNSKVVTRHCASTCDRTGYGPIPNTTNFKIAGRNEHGSKVFPDNEFEHLAYLVGIK